MKKILNTCALLLSLAAFAACEIPFALDNVSEPCIYVQFIPSGEYAVAQVALAAPAFKKTETETYSIGKSEITILADGKELPFEFIEPEEGELYMLNSRKIKIQKEGGFKPGEKVEISVRGHGGVPDIHAETSVPPAPDIEKITITPLEKGGHQIAIKLGKPVRDGEYYGLKTAVRTTIVSYTIPSVPEDFPFPFAASPADFPIPIQLDTTVYENYETAGQVASTSDINSLDLDAFASVNYNEGFLLDTYSNHPMMLLSGRQFSDDGTYSFYIGASIDFDFLDGIEISEDVDGGEEQPETKADGDGEEWGDPDDDQPDVDNPPLMEYIIVSSKTEYRMELYRLSEELYNYCKAQYLGNFDMLSNFGVSPPNFTYSNIRGGIGITGAMSSSFTPWYTVEETKEEEAK